MAAKKNASKKKAAAKQTRRKVANPAKYPRHSLEKSLRIPEAILNQNAGKECSDQESAAFVGVSYNGPYKSEIGSAKKYGLLTSPSTQRVVVTELAKKILRPKTPEDVLSGLRQSIQNAPDVVDVYQHYRGENIPDEVFF